MPKSEKTLIGRVEKVLLPKVMKRQIPARIDTGTKTSAIWASNFKAKDGILTYTLFDKPSQYYTGEVLKTNNFRRKRVYSTLGHYEVRYAVKQLIEIKGRCINVTFTLANRTKQLYPILLGRNVLHGKFIVDVKLSIPHSKDKDRVKHIRAIDRAKLSKEIK